MQMFLDILKNFGAGLIVGGIFALLRLPVPAPNAIPPVAGILGLTIGFIIVTTWILKTK